MLWKKFDCLTDSRVFLECDDECFYARDYISHGGYSASEGNHLIKNLQKHPSKRGTPEWPHKVRAIDQFARELTTVLPADAVVASIPSSKVRTDPEFDSRLEDTLARLVELVPSIGIETPIARAVTAQALHHGGTRRVNHVVQSLQWLGFSDPDDLPNYIVLIDDVITTGSTFKACQRLIHQQYPTLKVYGVFWARTVWPEATC